MPRTITRFAAAGACLAVAAAGCGGGSSSSSSSKPASPKTPEKSPTGDIPDTQAYVAVSPPGGGYSVKVPEGWAQRTTGRAVTFTDKLNTVELQARSAAGALTVASARTSELAKLKSTVKGFAAGSVTQVKRKAGTAVRIAYLADGSADPVTGKSRRNAVERYVFFRNGRDAVVTLSGPKGADNVDPWRIITDSLRWTR
jgi:hypothetical protein